MKILIIFMLLNSFNAFAWTINNSTIAGFPVTDIKIQIGSDSCNNANFTPSTLEALVQDAIDEYWNKVPTSALKLESSGNSGISLSGDDLTSAAAKANANSIIIGCSQNATLFTSNSILGVGGIACGSGVCRGVVLMNDKSGTNLGLVDRATVVTAFAHEFGHALGLGHSSINGALMYYSLTNKTQKNLHQDDMDGISYLYPNKKSLNGLGGACGTIDDVSKDKTQFFNSLLIGFLLVAFMINLFKKTIFNKKLI